MHPRAADACAQDTFGDCCCNRPGASSRQIPGGKRSVNRRGREEWRPRRGSVLGAGAGAPWRERSRDVNTHVNTRREAEVAEHPKPTTVASKPPRGQDAQTGHGGNSRQVRGGREPLPTPPFPCPDSEHNRPPQPSDLPGGASPPPGRTQSSGLSLPSGDASPSQTPGDGEQAR